MPAYRDATREGGFLFVFDKKDGREYLNCIRKNEHINNLTG